MLIVFLVGWASTYSLGIRAAKSNVPVFRRGCVLVRMGGWEVVAMGRVS